MICRKEIKERAKSAFTSHYWLCVAIFAILSGTGGGAVAGYLSVFYPIWSTLMIAALVFLGGPFSVSHARASLNVYDGEKPSFADIIWCFREGRYWKCVGAMALSTLFTSLPCLVICPLFGALSPFAAYVVNRVWELDSPAYLAVIAGMVLLGAVVALIPTIIIGLGLSQTAYVVTEEGLTGMAAVRRSRELMKGHKWELFVFGLSFIGWSLLNVISEGMAGIFYAGPYMSVSYAGYYRELTRG